MLNTMSIIIPAYNHAKEIELCLQSIQKQTYQNFEIIVVNDGSEDNTQKVLETFESKIKIINQKNKGANAARNRGFAESQGEYLLFCDADIIMKPQMLQKMVSALNERTSISFVYSAFKFGWKTFHLHSFDAELLKKVNYIPTTSLIRREHFPGFDESIKRFQDWDIWLTMLENERKGFYLPEILFKAIPHKGGKSRWLPSIAYKIPWKKLGLRIQAIEDFQKAREIIIKKHRLYQENG